MNSLRTTSGPDRREALKFGSAAAGTGLLSLGAISGQTSAQSPTMLRAAAPEAALPIPGVLQMYINDGYLKMVDDSLVYHRGFGDRPSDLQDANPSLTIPAQIITANNEVIPSRTYPLGAALPPNGRPEPLAPDPAHPGSYLVRRAYWASYFPERTIVAEYGSTIKIRVHNRLAQPHQLTFHNAGDGGADVGTGEIAPGKYKDLEFAAPDCGSYIYSDPTNTPVERTLGLFGALIVMDPSDPWCVKPGAAEFERQWIWICHDVEPEWAKTAAAGGTVDPRVDKPVPRYFTLNGKAGYESLGITRNDALNRTRMEDTLISGSARHIDSRDLSLGYTSDSVSTGQLVRLVNPGIVFHQMHFHGNHLWTVRRNGYDFPRTGGFIDDDGHVVLQQWEDVIELEPMDRKESLIPIKRPPDCTETVWTNRNVDWHYPMHCHAEPSQTAAGGMYPGGLVGHWTLAAPITGAI
ncbi:multicopper oxidase domain-containing protein [Arthrobacter monumenti]